MNWLRLWTLAIVAALPAYTFSAAPTLAATVACANTPSTADREFYLTTTPGALCYAYGTGNVGNAVSPFDTALSSLGYLMLDKSDDALSGVLEGSLTMTPPTSGLTGTFSILAPGFTSFILALKVGGGQLTPDWAAFLLPSGVWSGSWSISGQNELSHAVLYGLRDTSVVPLPAALPLFATGLAVLGYLGRRRQRKR